MAYNVSVASFRDWYSLAEETIRDLTNRELTGLYRSEWPEMRRQLIADHRHQIDAEPDRFKRFVRTSSAVLFGLARRLAPQRRLLFVAAQLLLIVSAIAIASNAPATIRFGTPSLYMWGGLAGAFLLITALLGLELLDKLKIRDEMELARQLQSELIPKELPQIDGLQLAAFNRIANTVGGDIYDFIPLPDRRLAVLFGDASGHGMAAGLIMAVAHASFRTQLEVDPNPPAVIATLNRILCQTGGPRSFFAGICLLLDPDGAFEVVVAGHPPILRVSPEGEIVESIGVGAYPLGVKRDNRYATLSGRLNAGELLFFHSDGLTEARSEAGVEYGDARLAKQLGRCGGLGASATAARVLADWREFMDGEPPDDDVTIAVIRKT